MAGENLLRILIQDDGHQPARPQRGVAPGPRSEPPFAPTWSPPPPPSPADLRPPIPAFDELFNPAPPPAPKLFEPPPAAEPEAPDPFAAALDGITDDTDDLGDALRQLAEQVTETTRALADATPPPVPGGGEGTYGFAAEEPAAPAGAPPDEGFPDWYPRYRQLQNRSDMLAEEGKTLPTDLDAELRQLQERLQTTAAAPQAPNPTQNVPAAPEAPAAPAAADTYGFAPETEHKPEAPEAPRPAAGGTYGFKEEATGPPEEPPIPLASDMPKGYKVRAPDAPGLAAGGEAAGEAAGGAELGVLAEAAGPIGLVAAGAQAASAALGAMEKGVQRAGQGLVALAGNDGIGMLQAATGAVTDSLRQIPIVGDALAKQFELATAAVTAYVQVTDAFVERGRELSKYNGDLAAANANASVTRLEADLKESEALGPSLAKLTENQAGIESDIRELLLPIKEAIADILAELSGVIKGGTGIAKQLAPVLKFLLDVITVMPLGVLRLIGSVLEQLNDWFENGPTVSIVNALFGRGKNQQAENQKQAELNSLMQQLFANLDRIAVPAGNGQIPPAMRPLLG